MNLNVLIPVFNTHPSHLMESVFSILNQDDGGKHRIIIIDDGSTSFETARALQFFDRYKNVEVHFKENGGTSDALNFGHKLVDSEYVAIQGSDDISHHSRFRLQIDYIKSDKRADVISTNLFSYYNDDLTRKPAFTSFFKIRMDRAYAGQTNWWANHGTVIYKQQSVMDCGGYDVKIKRGQDVDLWGRMKAKGFQFRCIPEVLYAWRRFR